MKMKPNNNDKIQNHGTMVNQDLELCAMENIQFLKMSSVFCHGKVFMIEFK
jgi:hypothetical protein